MTFVIIKQPTVSLRWSRGVLQQAWTIERRCEGAPHSREIEWRDVPTHSPDPAPQDDPQ